MASLPFHSSTSTPISVCSDVSHLRFVLEILPRDAPLARYSTPLFRNLSPAPAVTMVDAQGKELPRFSLPFCPHEPLIFNKEILSKWKKSSFEITHAAEADGKVAHGLLRPKREEPSRRRTPETRYFPS